MKNFILVVFLLLSFNTFPQDRSQWSRSSSGQNFQVPKMSLKGRLIDNETGEGLSYATISINTVDSILVSGGISDDNGKFKIDIDPRKMFEKIRLERDKSLRGLGMSLRAEVTYIGYKTRYIELPFTKDKREIDLKNIELESDATSLNEVTVRAEKSSLELKLDKRVFNVGKDLSNKGGTAEEILENIPSIDLDIEGNVSLRGSQSVRILVDGKPASMMGLDGPNAFKQLQGSEIDKVEIITNPSSRYSAEGSSGILNIILKKERLKGLNGSINLNTGYPTQNGVSTNFNYRKSKFSVFASLSANQRETNGGGFSNSDFFLPDTTYSSYIERDNLNNSLSFGGRAGFSFFPNRNNIFTFSVGSRFSDRNSEENNSYIDFDIAENEIARSNRIETSEDLSNNLSYSFSYTKNFKERGHNLKFDLSWSDNNSENNSNYNESRLIQRSFQEGSRYDQSIRVDYNHPFNENKGKIELGYKRDYDRMSSIYYAEQLFDNVWQNIPPSNEYNYYQDVNALYLQAGNKTGNLSYQLGIRFEDTDFYANMESDNKETSLRYSNWFPSAFITYELSKSSSFQLSYSKRLRRPRFWDLNPFWGLSDGRFNWEGNPFLEPELTDSYELGYLKEFKSGNIYIGTYYRHTEDEIERIFDVNDAGYSVFKPINLGYTNAYGIEINGSIEFTKRFRTTGSFNFFNSETEGDYKNQNFYSRSYSWRTRLTNNIKMFDDKLEGQVTFDYRGPSDSPQGKNLSSYGIDLSLSKDIFKNKRGTISLTVRDLTKSRLRRYERGGKAGDNYFTAGEFAWRRTQEFRLSLQYRINQNKRRGGQRGNYDPSEFQGGSGIFGN